MSHLCFIPANPLVLSSFHGNTLSVSARHSTASVPQVTRAKLDLVPGVPPGEDPLENAPMRYYKPRPAEDYSDRGFATPLPRTWEGNTDTIGVSDIEPVTEEELAKRGEIEVSVASSGAFLEFSDMVREERKQQLEELIARNTAPTTGRATCGEEEGKTFVSNYRTILVDGVKAVEYWGAPNGPVPRLFGGEGA